MDLRALSVLLLVCAQWAQAYIVPDGLDEPPIILDDDLVPQELNFPSSEDAEILYQGDMMLTGEQWRSLRQRKAIPDERYRWPKNATTGMVDIDYRYNDTIVSRPGVQKAMAALEAGTCVRFHEIPSAVAKPHLIFKTHASACNSAVGQVYFLNGQDVNVAPNCFTDDDVTPHELGHALGLYHEQSRSDRDDYVTIMLENVQPGMEHNFNKEVTNNYAVPYDYSSIMHYFPKIFSKNNLYTIVTKDPLTMPVITDSKGLSFMDKKIINLMYKCTDKWLAACGKVTDPCKNQGYTKSDCTCECPAGTSGANCETLNLSYTDALIQAKSPGSQRITAEGTVTSPGYPTPVTTASSRLQSIMAPECHKVQLTFNIFDLYGKSNLTWSDGTKTLSCWFMILQIQLDHLSPLTSAEYCGGDFTTPKTFESVGRFMVLTYSTKALAGNTKTGYSATVKFIPVAGCAGSTTTSPPTVTTTTKPASTWVSVTSGGTVPLTNISSGACSLVPSSNATIYFYRSPSYPNNYGKGVQCTTWFNTTHPRYLRVIPVVLTLGSSDSVDLYSPFKNTSVLNASKVGNATTLLTSSSRLTFVANAASLGGKFDLRIEVVDTICHQLIVLGPGSSGPLGIPANYPPGTVCEFWIRAPAGQKVKVAFSRFFIGEASCLRDYAVIDFSGDNRYLNNSTRYCGDNMYSPGTVVSSGNALNILVNGQWGGYQGLNATYSAVV